MAASLAQATTYYCAPDTFTPAGNDSNSGLTASAPKTHTWCYDNGTAGDVMIFAAGNYGGIDFEPTSSGSSTNPVTYQCAGYQTCRMDRVAILDIEYVTVIRFYFDTDYYDPTKSDTNPRVRIWGSNHIKFIANAIRAEPFRCAEGNPGPGCSAPSEYRRYNDAIEVGNDGTTSRASYAIGFYSDDTYGIGRSINGNHTQLQIHDADEPGDCDSKETNFLVTGTPDNPYIFSNEWHHSIATKGPCHVLYEYIDFQQAGTGRGDLVIPYNSDDTQSGGPLHGSSYIHHAVRFSTMSYGGSGTEENGNHSLFEVGMFGDTDTDDPRVANEVCMAHVSMWRPWGQAISLGRPNVNLNDGIDDVVLLNIAADDISWLYETEGGTVANLISRGYFLDRVGDADAVTDIYVDGIVYDPVNGLSGDKFLYKQTGVDAQYDSGDCPGTLGDSDIECGSSITRSTTQLFNAPASRDFTINDVTNLSGTAVPIATVVGSGTGSTISITPNRAQCFFDRMCQDGTADADCLRAAGDAIYVDTDAVNVTAVNTTTDTLTLSASITYADGDEIYFNVDSSIMDDIGAVQYGTTPPSPGPPDPGPGVSAEKHLRR